MTRPWESWSSIHMTSATRSALEALVEADIAADADYLRNL